MAEQTLANILAASIIFDSLVPKEQPIKHKKYM